MLPFNSTKTIMCILNELIAMSNIEYEPDLLSTLNNKYQLFEDEIPTKFPPKIQYFGIGIKGFKLVSETNSLLPYKPDPRNMDLYMPIPIICVPSNNDLSDSEREKYRIRVYKEINGIGYWCYYLKKLVPLNNNYNLSLVNLLTGEESDYNIDYGYLSPIPSQVAVPNQEDDTIEFNAYYDLVMELTGEEINSVINILYNGDYSYAHISEIGLYSGEDKLVTDNAGTTYTESIYTQLVVHSCNTGVNLSDPTSVERKVIRITQSTGFIL